MKPTMSIIGGKMKAKFFNSKSLKASLFTAFLAFMTSFAAVNGYAQDAVNAAPISGQVESVGVFKNGIAVVRERFDVPGVGVYSADAPLQPIHGAFFVQSDALVSTTASNIETEVDLSEVDSIDWTKDFQNCALSVVLPGEDKARVVRVIPTGQGDDGASDLSYSYANPYSSAPRIIGNYTNASKGVMLGCEDGSVVWLANPSALQSVVILEGAPSKLARVKPKLVFEVQSIPEEGKSASIWVSYLTRGISWAPQYRVDVLNDTALKIEQTAILINEWRDFSDASVCLYSGYPQIPLQNVISPMSPNVSLQEFFARLDGSAGGRDRVYMSQMTMNSIGGSMGFDGYDMLATASESSIGEGVDIFAQDVGKKSMRKGDRTLFTVGQAEVPYQKTVSWNIADARDSNGRPYDVNARSISDEARNSHYGQTTSGEASLEYSNRFREPWDVLNFNNPFTFPITTGPAVAYEGGRFLGQNSLYWTNPKEKTILPVTKALSVRVRSVEKERVFEDQQGLQVHEPGKAFLAPELKRDYWGKTVVIAGSAYRVAVFDAEISMTNQRSEGTRALVSRQFSGVLVKESLQNFDSEPEVVRLSEAAGAQGVGKNPQHELRAEVTLKPGETRTLKFSYQTFILM